MRGWFEVGAGWSGAASYGGLRNVYPVTRLLKDRNRGPTRTGCLIFRFSFHTPQTAEIQKSDRGRPTGPDFYRSIPYCI